METVLAHISQNELTLLTASSWTFGLWYFITRTLVKLREHFFLFLLSLSINIMKMSLYKPNSWDWSKYRSEIKSRFGMRWLIAVVLKLHFMKTLDFTVTWGASMRTKKVQRAGFWDPVAFTYTLTLMRASPLFSVAQLIFNLRCCLRNFSLF